MMKKIIKIIVLTITCVSVVSPFAAASFAELSTPPLSESLIMTLVGLSLLSIGSSLRAWKADTDTHQ